MLYYSLEIIVSTHSRTEAAAKVGLQQFTKAKFQHTAARRRLLSSCSMNFAASSVSTHSRTEAAAIYLHPGLYQFDCFNTQPHGGGCLLLRL